MHLTSPAARRAAWITLPAAVLLSGAVVATTSYAAFSDTTKNSQNAWTSGSVTISDDDAGAALFTVDDVLPGDSGERCITVTADTSVDSVVKLYAADVAGATSVLANTMTMKVELADAAVPADCTGFVGTADVADGTLASLLGKDSFDVGVGEWPAGAGTTEKTYKFSWELPADAANGSQDTTVTADFVFEAQNS